MSPHTVRRLALAAALVATSAGAQTPAPRRAASPAALAAHPGFYNGQLVVVRGILSTAGNHAVLTSPETDKSIPVVFTGTSPADGPVEVRATFWDIGRLQREDPRVTVHDLLRFLPDNGTGDWPRPGELLALTATDAIAVAAAAAPATLRLIALDPHAYAGQRVTVMGQFRGRNLYGDLPQAPGIDKWEFVLHSGDAAVWVTGQRPRGKGFDLDIGARLDTRTWLQVTGTLREGRGLVWIEATQAPTLAAPDTSFVIEPPKPPELGPQPEVVFSDPQDGDTDVPLKKPIRIQFSRDMNPEGFAGKIKWAYAASDAHEELPAGKLSVKYDRANRSVEIRIDDADQVKFRNVAIELDDSITASDGARLKPWSMTFTFAGE